MNLQPIPEGCVVFTDVSSSIAVVIAQTIVKQVFIETQSAQLLELAALILALQLFPSEALNTYTDSQHVTQIFYPLETATYIAPISRVHDSLLQLQGLLWQWSCPLFIGHLRAHPQLPSPLNKDNELADSCTHVFLTMSTFDNAQLLHRHIHLNTGSLHHHTVVTKEQATQIVKDCPPVLNFCPCSPQD